MTATRRTTRSGGAHLFVPAALAVAASLLAPAGARAQYMYLDSNGNGVHDVGDRLRTCTTRIDVWLDTAQNRDGTPATCGFGSGDLNLSHYEFALQVLAGTVAWGPMSNRIPGFTQNLARDSRDSTGASAYHNGWGTVTTANAVAPGLHHLATFSATPLTGNPRIEIIARHPNNGTGRSSFGSECPATPQHDHTNRFGAAWSDVDGLAEALAVDTSPLAVAPGIVVPQDGATIAFDVTADDQDADPVQTLTANLTGLPIGNDAVFSVLGLDTPGATGSFTWTPTSADSGDYVVTFESGNCLPSLVRSTVIHVIGTPTAVEGAPGLARDFLAPNVPNPFHPRTEIAYSLARPSTVRIHVIDAGGRRIRTLVNAAMPAGPHRASWDGKDGRGADVASGVYWCRLEAGAFRMSRRMILIR